MGNLRSVEKAFQAIGEKVSIVDSLKSVERLVIPGVGAFGAAMERLLSMKSEIQNFAKAGNPILGICLGQQLLFEESEEHGLTTGLGLLGGKVKYFSPSLGLKVPHIGWSAMQFRSSEMSTGLQNGDEVYFVHSLVTECSEPSDIAIVSHYGEEFAAAVQRRNIWGMQFHPEKSSHVGLQLLRNWCQQ